AAVARAGHRLQAQERAADGEELPAAVAADRRRGAFADRDVAAVEERVVDEPTLQMVVLDAVVPDVGQPGVADGERADAARAEPVGHESEEHTSELQSRFDLVCRLLLEKK